MFRLLNSSYRGKEAAASSPFLVHLAASCLLAAGRVAGTYPLACHRWGCRHQEVVGVASQPLVLLGAIRQL